MVIGARAYESQTFGFRCCIVIQHPSLPLSCCSNTRLSDRYLTLARDLDVMEPKTPDDVYKTHLEDGRVPAGGRC